ncbi:MAG: hypothetical protein JRN20_19070 [Nitrososphaerota archaeon]|nr:hypothetical protein [Nitrososphaerota archaeon]
MQRSTTVPKQHEQQPKTAELQASAIEIIPIPKLETESRVDTVGTVGGLRVYIPSRMAKDSQFPLSPGETVEIKAIKYRKGEVSGILITKKE